MPCSFTPAKGPVPPGFSSLLRGARCSIVVRMQSTPRPVYSFNHTRMVGPAPALSLVFSLFRTRCSWQMHARAEGDLLPLRTQPRPGGGVPVLRSLPGVRQRGGRKRGAR